jgi:hypothetical protein
MHMKNANRSKETYLIQMPNSCHQNKVEMHENKSPKKMNTTNMTFENLNHILTIKHKLTITVCE